MRKQKRFDIKAGISLISDLWFDSIKMFRIVIIPTFFIWNQQAVTDKCFSFGFVWLRWMVWVDIWDNRKSE